MSDTPSPSRNVEGKLAGNKMMAGMMYQGKMYLEEPEVRECIQNILQEKAKERDALKAEIARLNALVSEKRDNKADITKEVLDDRADDLGVDRLAAAMKAKLAIKRAEGYYGWNNDCTMERLRGLLLDHIGKGDILDVANFAMMIWNREHPNG